MVTAVQIIQNKFFLLDLPAACKYAGMPWSQKCETAGYPMGGGGDLFILESKNYSISSAKPVE